MKDWPDFKSPNFFWSFSLRERLVTWLDHPTTTTTTSTFPSQSGPSVATQTSKASMGAPTAASKLGRSYSSIFIPSLSKAQCQGCSECSVKACWISRLICILKHRLKPVRNILHVYTLSQKPYFVPFYTCSVSFCMQKKCEPRVISFAKKKKTYWKRQFFWNTLNMYILVWYGRIQKLREL